MERTWQLFSCQDVSSTMDVAQDLLLRKPLDLATGLIVLAKQQTQGRGRYQRRWDSPHGNLYSSFSYVAALSERNIPLYSFSAALALYDSISELIGGSSALYLKWPNDLLLNDKKIAGILLEVLPTQPKHLIIGIGVNLKVAPSQTPYPASALCLETSVDITPRDFLKTLTPWLTFYIDLVETQGFEKIRQKWLKARHPQPILSIKRYKGSTFTESRAEFLDLDQQGRLICKECDTQKVQIISAGDIY
jgi:BirA family biotin operon repressor/biotin-[acetyl-CoA-carboxylase] ligase